MAILRINKFLDSTRISNVTKDTAVKWWRLFWVFIQPPCVINSPGTFFKTEVGTPLPDSSLWSFPGWRRGFGVPGITRKSAGAENP